VWAVHVGCHEEPPRWNWWNATHREGSPLYQKRSSSSPISGRRRTLRAPSGRTSRGSRAGRLLRNIEAERASVRNTHGGAARSSQRSVDRGRSRLRRAPGPNRPRTFSARERRRFVGGRRHLWRGQRGHGLHPPAVGVVHISCPGGSSSLALDVQPRARVGRSFIAWLSLACVPLRVGSARRRCSCDERPFERRDRRRAAGPLRRPSAHVLAL